MTHEPEDVLPAADVVYTDTWPWSADPVEREHLAQALRPYQITAEKLDRTPAESLFLPCPPVHRGEEVTAEAMTSARCRVLEAKEQLLYAQGALLAHLLSSA